MTAYVIQTKAGIRMFDTIEAAKTYGDKEDSVGKPLCWHMPVAVAKANHYQGAIGQRGVLFTEEDQSFSQLILAINEECLN